MSKIKSTKQANGFTLDFDGVTKEYSLDNMPTGILQQLARHGLEQKVRDSFAGHTTVAEAMTRAQAVYDGLINGEWSPGRINTGGDLAEAVAKATGRTIAEATEMLATKSAAERDAMKKHPQIVAALAEIRAKRAAQRAADAPSLDSLFG